ncbi:uncharacterized protein LOC143893202 isoform X2 [Temnothorax americanus]|uniref:uncharacterized protein LOC143893202 isoform X2 n=1 Tax=Temnothorax americanus TaxID=1964332 RepID=UPI004068FD64
MESEARNQNNDYNKFFFATMCHVCKRFGDGVSLKRCSNCKMISYCGKEHQKQHWKQHKSLCKAIRDVLQNYSMADGGETTEEWTDKKLKFKRLVSFRLGRILNLDETDMFDFPRECLVCHERNAQSLKDCQKCLASFCQNHKDGEENNPSGLHSYLQHVSYTGTFQNMKNFIKAFGNIQTHSEMSYDVLAAKHSLDLTLSLTLFHAMRLLNYVPKSNDLVVHVIGANCVEEISLTDWELLPRLIGMSVVVILIGPELTRKLYPSHVCDNCRSRKEKCLTFEFHDVLYENYVRSSSFVKPDLVVGFNLDIHKHKLGSSEETWALSIQMLAKQNCPFLLTFVTLQNLEKGTNKINTILGRKVNYFYSGENPFASLSPFRNVAPKYVFYMNQYVIIYKSLCS